MVLLGGGSHHSSSLSFEPRDESDFVHLSFWMEGTNRVKRGKPREIALEPLGKLGAPYYCQRLKIVFFP